MKGLHWADRIAQRVINERGDKDKYVVAAGATPSGVIHMGNFRDLITADAVRLGLEAQGKSAEMIFSWDNFDAFDKVPKGVPEDFGEFLGFPLTRVSPLESGFSSYADQRQQEFMGVIGALGVNPRFISQTDMYVSGKYEDAIRLAFEKRHLIAEIQNRFKSEGTELSGERLKHYVPFTLYCPDTGREGSIVEVSKDGKTLSYRTGTIKQDEKGSWVFLNEVLDDKLRKINFEEALDLGSVKLRWKIDWPMRWGHEGVDFEPAGKDHGSPNGSYDVALAVAPEVFGQEGPSKEVYEFIGMKGAGKMSSSSGVNLSPEVFLGIYEPEVIRMAFLQVEPRQGFSFHMTLDEVNKRYTEHDRALRQYEQGKLQGNSKRTLELSLVDGGHPLEGKVPLPFRQAIGHAGCFEAGSSEMEKFMSQLDPNYDRVNVERRIEMARNFLEGFAPNQILRLVENNNQPFYDSLSSNEQTDIGTLAEIVKVCSDLSIKDFETVLYDVVKRSEMPKEELEVRQRQFFKNVYGLLFGTEKGPRLATYFGTRTNIEEVSNRLSF